MASRLRKAINQQRRMAYTAALKKTKEYSIDYGETSQDKVARNKNLPYPKKVHSVRLPSIHIVSTPIHVVSTPIHVVSTPTT
ncbi:hypothetical protein LCGC14_1776420, partial [marine sediment metagenome]